jgi:hypothetical protein
MPSSGAGNYTARLRGSSLVGASATVPGHDHGIVSPKKGGRSTPEEYVKFAEDLDEQGVHASIGVFECGPYWVILRVAHHKGRTELAELTIRPHVDRAGSPSQITTTDALRRIPLPAMVATLSKMHVDNVREFSTFTPDERDPWGLVEAAKREVQELESGGGRQEGRGRPRLPLGLMRDVAAEYRRAERQRLNPRAAVAVKWTVSPSTASKWIRRCRDLELLPETSPGVARS